VRKLLLLAALIAAVFALPATAATTTKTTTLKDDYFTKGKLTVKKNTTVVWKWKTSDEHTVTDFDGRFGSKQTTKGSFKHKFRKKGKFTVYCLVHPVEMRQRIVVK
jgi:plastocyanin